MSVVTKNGCNKTDTYEKKRTNYQLRQKLGNKALKNEKEKSVFGEPVTGK